jgi:hypothetical protein
MLPGKIKHALAKSPAVKHYIHKHYRTIVAPFGAKNCVEMV